MVLDWSSKVNERRIRWIFLFLVIGQFILITAQIPVLGSEQSRLESALLGIVSPLGQIVGGGTKTLLLGAGNLALRRTLLDENRRLRAEVDELRRLKMRSFGLEEEVERLTEAVVYSRTTGNPLQVADIVYIDHASWLQTMVLSVDRATVEMNQPVVSGKGLVGRVVVVGGPYAKVQLITDLSASVGVMIQRTRRQGLARGGGGGELDLDFVSLQADVRVGDLVVTAGIDGIYPRGIPVGTVTSVEPGPELFHEIRMVPTVDFGLLDQVYVLDRVPVPEEIKEALPDAQP